MRVVRDAGRARGAADAGALARRSRLRRRHGVPREAGRPRAKHIEVQILGDSHGNIVHLFERDCSVQRRNQKVVEVRPRLVAAAGAARAAVPTTRCKIARHVRLQQRRHRRVPRRVETGAYYFLEVNPRIQVEHTVTEAITARDLVQAQIRIAQGYKLSDPEIGIGSQDEIQQRGVAIRCVSPPRIRATTSCPTRARSRCTPRGRQRHPPRRWFGLRRRARVAYYDSLLAKITASGLEWNTSGAR